MTALIVAQLQVRHLQQRQQLPSSTHSHNINNFFFVFILFLIFFFLRQPQQVLQNQKLWRPERLQLRRERRVRVHREAEQGLEEEQLQRQQDHDDVGIHGELREGHIQQHRQEEQHHRNGKQVCVV